MKRVVQGTTKVYAIIGWPVAHSRSPLMHNAAFEALGLDCVYVPFAVPPEHLATAVEGLRAMGVAGWNVTIPHKTAIMPLLDEVSPEAVAAGAVNTVRQHEGRLIGYNTDGAGLLVALERELSCTVTGKQVVVLGAGGAARGAVAALMAAGASAITVVNRTITTAQRMVGQLKESIRGQAAIASLSVLELADLSSLLPVTDILINATSLGMHGEEIEGVELALLPKTAKVYDMVYGAVPTPLVHKARHYGLMASDGVAMLVAQGELAFQRWTGLAPPAGVMRAALDAAS